MASALDLAGVLRGLSAEELTTRLRERSVHRPTVVRDAFDLAEALLEASSVRDALSRLDRTSLLLLQVARTPGPAAALLAGAEPAFDVSDDDAARALDRVADLFLLLRDGDRVTTLDAVAEVLDADPVLARDALAGTPAPVVLEAVDVVDRQAQDAQSAERLFAVVVEVAELVRAVADSPARELAKGGLALPETRRLAEAARVDVDDVVPILAAARAAGLVELGPDGWIPASAAESWLLASWSERWAALVSAWLDALPREIRSILDQRAETSWGDPLETFSEWLFPAGGSWVPERLDAFARSAELFGLTASGRPTSVAVALLHDGAEAASAIVTTLLPAPIEKVYLQHDLTAVSPGPLDPALDGRLRSIAVVESAGLAATYRITEAGIRRALSDGETEESLRAFLTELSSTGIPQPVDYLLTETAARHGRYRVSTLTPDQLDREATVFGAVSQLRSDDPALLDTVAVDQALSPLGLRRIDPHRMLCRFEAESLYWTLSDERYPVVLEDAGQEPLRSPIRRRPKRSVLATPTDPIGDLVARVVESSGDATEEATDRAWIARQLDAAVRGRLTVVVTVALADGTTSELQMEPTGVGGGRVRGRDRKSDIERTLPLSSIVAVATPQEA
ncbi:hypothetical protein AS850_02535 [Frondihabitans sp. 762G35]|uniref:helicase-associated domain-containing protein n=1 Tax=Frondihabitans sp. 762G35 TaxID=1446794 RepID=UPI000D21370D|nr:helicase-associated domain-containing protein [Frondihabitans sp. 762G35]ARC55950.1 hypothetical protein AS850_02535 [Frondihabitans sp. 762G35]